MNIAALTVAAVCFYGDGSPLSDLCVSSWEADTVIECATQGDTRVPLHINTGTANPGPGFVFFYSTRAVSDGRVEVELLFSTRFESRGSTSAGAGYFEANYGVSEETGFLDGLEGCTCHSRSVFPDNACEKAAAARE